MLFLGINSWKGTSCFNGGRALFFRWGGFIFKWGCTPWGGTDFDGGFSKKSKDGVRHPPHAPPTMGNPGQEHDILWEVTTSKYIVHKKRIQEQLHHFKKCIYLFLHKIHHACVQELYFKSTWKVTIVKYKVIHLF